MMKITFFLLLVLSFTSCSRTQAPIVEYKLNVSVPTSFSTSTECRQQTLKVANAFTPNMLMLNEMNYVSGLYKMNSFTESSWSEAPSKAITMQIVKVLENSQLYANVAEAESHVKSDLILENSIEDFMQYFSKDETESHVKVVLRATLIDAKTKKSLGHQRFEVLKQSNSINAYGGVVALNKALEEVLENEVKWLGEMCK